MRVNRKSFNDEKFFKTVLGVWLLGVIACLAFWVAVIYVVAHFVLKFW